MNNKKNNSPAPANPKSSLTHRSTRRRGGVGVIILGILIVLILAIIVLVITLPYMLSTKSGTKWLSNTINKSSPQQIEIGDLSLRWWKQSRIGALRVLEADGTELCVIDEVSLSKGLGQLMKDPMKFGAVIVDSPRVFVVQKATDKDKEEDKDEPDDMEDLGELPLDIFGSVTVKNGYVSLQREDGKSIEVSQIQGEVTLAGLNEITGTLSLQTSGEGQLAGDFSIKQLVSAGKIDPQRAQGQAHFRTEHAVDLGVLADWAAESLGLDGSLDFDFTTNFDGQRVTSEFKTTVTQLAAAGIEGMQVNPVDVNLAGKAELAENQLQSDLTLDSLAGKMQAKLACPIDQSFSAPETKAILQAILDGAALALPKVEFEATGNVDLAQLSKAIPGVLKFEEGMEVTQGQIDLDYLRLQSGSAAKVQSAMQLTNLAVLSDGESIAYEPMNIGWDLELVEGQGLLIHQAEVLSDFLELTMAGDPQQVQTRFSGDLSQLNRRVQEFYPIAEFDLNGQWAGQMNITRQSERMLSFDMQMGANDLLYRQEERQLALARVDINESGQIVLTDDGLEMIAIDDARVILNERDVDLQASGRWEKATQLVQGSMNLEQLRIGMAIDWLKGLGMGQDLEDMDGLFQVQTDFEFNTESQQLLSKGMSTLANVVVQEQPVTVGDNQPVTLDTQWDGLAFNAGTQQVDLSTLAIKSSMMQFDAQSVSCRLGEEFTLQGQADLSADLQQCSQLAHSLSKKKDMPDFSGQLIWSGQAQALGSEIKGVGQGQIVNLMVRSKDTVYEDPEVSFKHDMTIYSVGDGIGLEQVELTSRAVAMQMRGQLQQVSGPMVVDLSGEYEAQWDEITKLMHQFVPNTAETISLAGTSKNTFTFTGPANDADAQPKFIGLNGDFGANWVSANVYGFEMGEALFEPKLRNGILEMPLTTIATSGGKVRVGGMVDLTTPDPVFRLEDEVQMVEGVQLTRKLAHQLLSRFNPIFAQVLGIEGYMGLQVADLNIPFGEDLKTSGRGRGKLVLRDLKLRPGGGLLGEIMRLGGIMDKAGDTLQLIKVNDVDFEIKEGRIYYENFALVLPFNYDIAFKGSVGFDDSLKLTLSLPIASPLLKTLKVDKAGEFARVLSDTRLNIPLMGNRLAPKMDLSSIDMAGLLKKGGELLLLEQTGKALENILKPGQKKPDGQQTDKPQTPDAEQTPEKPKPAPTPDAPETPATDNEKPAKDESKPKKPEPGRRIINLLEGVLAQPEAEQEGEQEKP